LTWIEIVNQAGTIPGFNPKLHKHCEVKLNNSIEQAKECALNGLVGDASRYTGQDTGTGRRADLALPGFNRFME
jgi:hypothetical protein